MHTPAPEFSTPHQDDPLRLAQDVARIIATYASDVDEQAVFPEHSIQELRQSGLMGLMVPTQYGGMGASFETMRKVAQTLAGACLSTGMIWAMHCQQVATLVDHAPESLKARTLPRIASGDLFVASVTSERSKGGHLLSAMAALVPASDGVLLERDAPTVTGGAFGDGFLITMRANPDAPPSEVVLAYADRSQVELEMRSSWNSMGMRGTASGGLSIKGRLPEDQIISPPGGFDYVAARTMIPAGHIAWAACWLGSAQGAFRQVVGLLRDPAARKDLNVQSDLFADRLARVRLHLDTVSAYLSQIIQEYEGIRLDKDYDFRAPQFHIHINNLKVLASETMFHAVDQLIQLSGLRFGYTKNPRVPLERLFRDLRSASLMYHNDRLLIANGRLSLLDTEVTLA